MIITQVDIHLTLNLILLVTFKTGRSARDARRRQSLKLMRLRISRVRLFA